MKYLEGFRNATAAQVITRELVDLAQKLAGNRDAVRIMEVCGTHTMAIHRYALKLKITPNIELISGPGCPVCVTENDYIDKAIALGKKKEVIITTFGDMLRVPGSRSSLEKNFHLPFSLFAR